MNKIRTAVTVVALAWAAASANAQTTAWKIDSSHSEADFAIKHLAISTVHGSFRGITGTINLDPAHIEKSSVAASIDVTGVDTGVAARDTHLKSPDFFDTAKFPAMTFTSTKVVQAGDHYDVTGDLTLHGVTKSVVLDLETPGKEQIDGRGKARRGFTATTTINRKDFGLVWNGTLKSGDSVLSDDVKIELDIEVAPQ
jgi:polyisoprenoid-binding protein YceI